MRQLLKTRLVDMDLSVRALNCLKAADVETLGELVSYNKNDLLKFRNFGKKSLTELEDLIESKGVKVYVDPKASMFLIGSEMDYTKDKFASRFVFHNPNEKSTCGCGESFNI